jgi:hypothetical protein
MSYLSVMKVCTHEGCTSQGVPEQDACGDRALRLLHSAVVHSRGSGGGTSPGGGSVRMSDYSPWATQ